MTDRLNMLQPDHDQILKKNYPFSVFKSSPALIAADDHACRCIFVNDALKNYTGKTDEIYDWTKEIYSDDIPVFKKQYETNSAGKKNFETEFRIKNKNGEFRWIKSSSSP